jgi:hypothetical protein
MLRYFIVQVFFIFSHLAGQGQDIWLRPEKYFYNAGETAKIQLFSGVDFIAEPVPFKKDSIERIDLLANLVTVDLRRHFSDGDKPELTIKLENEGVAAILFVTKPMLMNYDASTFKNMLSDFDLQDSHSLNDVEKVSLKKTTTIKSYLRVGKTVSKRPEAPLNSGIEIMPDKNPLTLKKGDRIVFTVLKDGKPAFGVRVKIWNRWNNRTTIQNIYTQQDGTISTTISSPGDWMVSILDVKKENTNVYIVDRFNMIFGYR